MVPLSYSQERLWFIHKLQGSVQYHIPIILDIKGNLDIEILEDSFRYLIERHTALRTVIKESKGVGYQEVLNSNDWKLKPIKKVQAKDVPLKKLIRDIVIKPFNLDQDYMFRCSVYSKSKNEHILISTLHHISSDGWSSSILVNEMMEIYNSLIIKKKPVLPQLEVNYQEYAIWQRTYLQGELLENKLKYWEEKLQNVEPIELPIDLNRPALQSFNGDIFSFNLDQIVAGKIQTLSKQRGITPFMSLLSVFAVLLKKYSGQSDICVGTPIAGRQQKVLENIIGYFINTLALRVEVSDKDTFEQLLLQTKKMTLDAYKHQDVPFEKIVDRVAKNRDLSRSPIFQVMFAYQNTPKAKPVKFGDLELNREGAEVKKVMFDLTLNIHESPDGLNCSFHYCTDLFRKETIERMAEGFLEILETVLDSSNQKISEIKGITQQQEKQILKDFNSSVENYPKEKTIVSLFEEMVIGNPDKIALEIEGRTFTYSHLDRRINQLANHLLKMGVKKGDLVPVCLDRNENLIIALMAVLKAGGTYIPIDPEFPESRIAFMLSDAGAEYVITDDTGLYKVRESGATIINIEKDSKRIELLSGNGNFKPGGPSDLMYIIYTSGSTGNPKGVMIENRSVVNLINSISSKVGFGSKSSMFSVTTYSFDISMLEFFMPLVNGGKLVLCSKSILLDVNRLKKSISSEHITHMQATPSLWQTIVESGWENKNGLKILVGGEALNESLKNELTAIAETYNVYGPTETTIWSTIQKLSADEKVLIGKPLGNNRIYILDDLYNPVPVGVRGNIYIAGDGLARGYHNNLSLTNNSFISGDFFGENRIYKTGDYGRWLYDGKIEYLGRGDHQVKIRGYRIELGDIESTIQKDPDIRSCAVVVRTMPNQSKVLAAYVVCSGNFNKKEFIDRMRKELPEYMVPGMIIEQDMLPMTPNGKVNRKALPEIDVNGKFAETFVAPQNDVEKAIAEIWQKLLGISKVGIHDNFFELGGHSLMAMKIISELNAEFNIVLDLKDIFRFTNIHELSNFIQTQISLHDEDEDDLDRLLI